MNEKEITGHVEFARMFADVIGYLHGLAQEDINRVGDAVESLAEMFYTHRAKHDSEAAGGVVSANGGAKVYPDMGSNAESCVAALKTVEDVRNSRTTDGRISTTEDIQRGWAENEKTRVYEDG